MTDTFPERAMVIMAHPDDPEFSVGGTMALWAAAGADITYLILTNGNKGYDDPRMTPDRLVALRQEEQRAAANVLGVKRVIFFDEADGELVSTLSIRQRVVAEIRRHRPQAVVAPDPTRYFFRDVYINHPDHRAAGEIALAAIFPAAGNRMYHPELLETGLEPHDVKEVWLANPTEPNRWVDITSVFATKLEAIRCHASQVRDPENLEERLRSRSQAIDEYGRTVYREGFHRLVIR